MITHAIADVEEISWELVESVNKRCSHQINTHRHSLTIEVSTPRRSSLIRSVPGVSLVLVSGLRFRADRGRSRFNGLRLGFESGAVVAKATPGGKIRKTRAPAGPSGGGYFYFRL